MKKIELLLFAFLFTLFINTLSSCSDNEEIELNYTVTLAEECNEEITIYCITKEQYEEIEEKLEYEDPRQTCIYLFIRDINNDRQQGYYQGKGISSISRNCN